MMTWATNPAGARWLLEHGADPNLPWGADAESPLHVAARRWDVAMVDLLLQHGADPHRRRADGRTPHTLAELHGNRDIAERLLALGAQDELSPLERFVAACARGDRAAATRHARGAALARARSCGPSTTCCCIGPPKAATRRCSRRCSRAAFDPDARDKDNVTPLHRAAMGGHPEAVRGCCSRMAPTSTR